MPDPSPVVEVFSVSHAQICDGTTSFLNNLAQAVSVDLDIYGVNDASLAADTGNFDNVGDNVTLSRWNWLNFATLTVQAGYLSFPNLARMSGQPLTTTNVSATNEVQTLTSNGASAGTFTLTYRGQTTAGIAYNAASSAVQTAIQALSTVGSGQIVVSGGPANTTSLVFTAGGTFAAKALDLITVNTTGLTGATGGVLTRTTAGTGATINYGIDLWHEDSMNVAPMPGIVLCPSKDKAGMVRRFVFGLYKLQFGPIGFDGPSDKDGLKVNYEATALMSDTDETGVAFADGKKRIGRLLSIA